MSQNKKFKGLAGTSRILIETSFYLEELSESLRCQRRQGNEDVLQAQRAKTSYEQSCAQTCM